MRECSRIDSKWLIEVAPHFYEDTKLRNLEAKRQREIEDKDLNFAKPKKIKKEENKKSMLSMISDMD